MEVNCSLPDPSTGTHLDTLLAKKAPRVPGPRDWPERVKTGLLHVISLAQLALTAARARASKKRGVVVRLRTQHEDANREISLLEEELRLKDLRIGRAKPRRRPHYRGVDRLAILELRAARAWSTKQTAERFFLQPQTIAEWMKRVDEPGDRTLVETAEPVNRFPDFVRYIIKRLKVLCPQMGKKRIAQTLARAGLHLGVTTVGRILKEREDKEPEPAATAVDEASVRAAVKERAVKATKPNDVWQTDLTVVPTAAGFWAPWLPFSVSQVWPFSWWVACVVDHFSRRVMGFAVFSKEPTSVEVRAFLGRVVKGCGKPRFLVSDKGRQFDCSGFRAWCDRKGIEPRYASTGSLRATAVVERFFLSLKEEWLRRILVPLDRDAMQRELACYSEWFERWRVHQGLGGETPRDVFEGRPTVEKTRPKATAIPRSELVVRFHEGRGQLPIVEIKRGRRDVLSSTEQVVFASTALVFVARRAPILLPENGMVVFLERARSVRSPQMRRHLENRARSRPLKVDGPRDAPVIGAEL